MSEGSRYLGSSLWSRRFTSIATSKDGKRIASASEDTTEKIWSVDTGKELATLRGHKDAVMSVAFCPDGQRVISGSKGVVRIWNAAK